MSASRLIKVKYLARVEGEGALYIQVRDREVRNVRLEIFEPPRFFEAFLRGREFHEVPDITARICGICPIAYQMSSVHALEQACGVEVGGMLRLLRRLIYCGEWIESHALHVFMLHLPDFLGYQDAIAMAKDHGDLVKTALRIKKTGNELMTLLGGRAIHPINVRVGGFYSVPTKARLHAAAEELKWARDASREAVKVVCQLTFPELEQDYNFVALRHEEEYPFNEGRLVSSGGLNISIQDYESHFVEYHVKHSNALHSTMTNGTIYHVGPLARYNLNFDKLSPLVQEVAVEAGVKPPCSNPFKTIIVRALEVLWAFDEALRLIDAYQPPDAPFVEVVPRAGIGYGCSEAPRGICWHRYEIDAEGMVQSAKIVPPTSQNQATIEDDLRVLVKQNLDLNKEELTWRCEQAIRNYDPCISCATHFLKLIFVSEQTS